MNKNYMTKILLGKGVKWNKQTNKQTNKQQLQPRHLQEHKIEFTETEKLLGVQVDNNVMWKTQVEKT
jgi:hypothetical protein